MICDHLTHARETAKYGVTTYSCWGDLPESVFVSGVPYVTGRYFENQIVACTRRFNQCVYEVSRKQDVLDFAVELLETHRPGDVFPCTDSRVRVLLREPNPLLVRARRENTGMCWSVAA
jgi:hypothetical protein